MAYVHVVIQMAVTSTRPFICTYILAAMLVEYVNLDEASLCAVVKQDKLGDSDSVL